MRGNIFIKEVLISFAFEKTPRISLSCKPVLVQNQEHEYNRPFAAKPSRDLLFIKLWATTLRMPEMEKACRKHQNGQV